MVTAGRRAVNTVPYGDAALVGCDRRAGCKRPDWARQASTEELTSEREHVLERRRVEIVMRCFAFLKSLRAFT